MSNIIINIPHSSTLFPNEFYEKLLISREELDREISLLTDLDTDKLIEDKYNILKAKYSRIYCDVERFADDNEEVMSKRGMGAVYSKTLDGKDLILIDKNYRDEVIKTYYNEYHNKFYELTHEILNSYDRAIIIDLHSFSDLLLDKLDIECLNTPDICLGYSEDFIDIEMLNFIKKMFLENGYSVSFNSPYSGSIVPYEYYVNNNHRIISIMIEINKRVYLDNEDNFMKLSRVLNNIVSKL